MTFLRGRDAQFTKYVTSTEIIHYAVIPNEKITLFLYYSDIAFLYKAVNWLNFETYQVENLWFCFLRSGQISNLFRPEIWTGIFLNPGRKSGTALSISSLIKSRPVKNWNFYCNFEANSSTERFPPCWLSILLHSQNNKQTWKFFIGEKIFVKMSNHWCNYFLPHRNLKFFTFFFQI